MKLGIIGQPLGHSVSPELHSYLLDAAGLAGEYLKYDTPPDGLATRLGRLQEAGLRGFNVTIPFKSRIIPHLERLSKEARRVGAVNTVSCEEGGLSGYNTDVDGIIKTLALREVDVSDRNVIVLGGGGAARAAVFAVLVAGSKDVVVANRTLATAGKIVADMSAVAPGASCSACNLSPDDVLGRVRKGTLLIQCTPLGTWPDVAATPVDVFGDMTETVVFDLVYRPLETHFMRQCRAAGAETIDGLDMLIFQGAASLDIWSGRELPLDYDSVRKKMEQVLLNHEKD